MILFDLIKKTTTGPNANTIKEVRWSGSKCVVNGDKTGDIHEVTLKSATADGVMSERNAMVKASKADLFAILSCGQPVKFGNQFRSKFVYAEVSL